jgi:hypothetical protein
MSYEKIIGGILMNNRYETLSEASKVAVTRCNEWGFATTDEVYDSKSLIDIAAIHDEETYMDEDSFYLVSQEGAIGFSEDGETIDWLFIPLNSTEDLSSTLKIKATPNFCWKCGKAVTPGARFCGACGEKIC